MLPTLVVRNVTDTQVYVLDETGAAEKKLTTKADSIVRMGSMRLLTTDSRAEDTLEPLTES